MSIMDMKQKVLIEVTANTKDAVRNLNTLEKATTGTVEATSKLGLAAKSALADFSKDLQGMAKSQAMSVIQKGIGDITGKLREMTGIPIGGQGTAIGFMLGGPAGAAIGTLVETMDSGFKKMVADAKYAAQGIDVFGDALSGILAKQAALHDSLALTASGFVTMRTVADLAAGQIASYDLLQGGSGAGVSSLVKGRRMGGPRQSKFSDATQAPYTDWSETGGATAGALSQSMAADGVPRDMYGREIQIDIMTAHNGLLSEAHERMQALASIPQGPTLAEKLFGTVTEVDGYRESWGALTSVATAGYSAMVDGSLSVGAAMKMAAGDAIKAIGLKLLIRGAEETAEGVSMLAGVYTAGLAPGHFAAAGKFFAGAALAGVVAHSLGTSGGASAGGASARPSAPDSRGSSASSGSGSTDRIIVYDDAFAENNAHERRLRAEKLVRRVTGSGAVRSN